eukprot:364848-Chlamydomonas_euryale.AAC.15
MVGLAGSCMAHVDVRNRKAYKENLGASERCRVRVSQSYRETGPRRVCLCGANAIGRNQRRQEAQQRLMQIKHGRGSASARRHKRCTSIPSPSHGAYFRDFPPNHFKAGGMLERVRGVIKCRVPILNELAPSSRTGSWIACMRTGGTQCTSRLTAWTCSCTFKGGTQCTSSPLLGRVFAHSRAEHSARAAHCLDVFLHIQGRNTVHEQPTAWTWRNTVHEQPTAWTCFCTFKGGTQCTSSPLLGRVFAQGVHAGGPQRIIWVRVRVRVTGSGPKKGMPVLSSARQRGSSSGVGAVTENATAHDPEPPHSCQSLIPPRGAHHLGRTENRPRHGNPGWLRTVSNGAPFVTVPCALLDPLCHASLDTGVPCVGPLPVTLTLIQTPTHTADGVISCVTYGALE